MFMRIDKLQAEPPAPKKPDPNAAAALQEMLGGKYGEMSTLGNYMFQSFNFRSKAKLRPFYSLVASITAEELGHVELVSNGVAMLNAGPDVEANEKGGVEIEKMLPTPNIDLSRIPECQKYLNEGSHRRLYRFSPDDYQEMASIWGNGEVALPGDPPGELEVVDGHPDGGKIHNLTGVASAFTPDYAPEEMFEIASKLYQKSR